eukprot:scaffold32506_cov112-Isochrysis_galbana.AAC.3
MGVCGAVAFSVGCSVMVCARSSGGWRGERASCRYGGGQAGIDQRLCCAVTSAPAISGPASGWLVRARNRELGLGRM